MKKYIIISIIIPIVFLLVLVFLRNNFLSFNFHADRNNAIKILTKIYGNQQKYYFDNKYFADSFDKLKLNYEDLSSRKGVFTMYVFFMGNDIIYSRDTTFNYNDLELPSNIISKVTNNTYTAVATVHYPTLKNPDILILKEDGTIELVSNSFVGSSLITWDACELYLFKNVTYRYCSRNKDIILKNLNE